MLYKKISWGFFLDEMKFQVQVFLCIYVNSSVFSALEAKYGK